MGFNSRGCSSGDKRTEVESAMRQFRKAAQSISQPMPTLSTTSCSSLVISSFPCVRGPRRRLLTESEEDAEREVMSGIAQADGGSVVGVEVAPVTSLAGRGG